MKSKLTIIGMVVFAFTLRAGAETDKPDPFEAGMRQAFTDYQNGDNAAAAERLRELLKMIEEKGAAQVGEVLPDSINGWKGESLKKDDLGIVGGGISISRVYVSGKKGITAKVMKDAPIVKRILPLLAKMK